MTKREQELVKQGYTKFSTPETSLKKADGKYWVQRYLNYEAEIVEYKEAGRTKYQVYSKKKEEK